MKKILFLLLACWGISSGRAQDVSLNFAGDDDWITGTNNLLPQGNAPRTIETWVRYSTSKNDMSLFNYGTFAYNEKFTLHLYNGVYIIGEGNDLATGYSFNDGNWHHLAVTHDGTTTKVFVDGVLRGSRNTTYNTTGYDYQMGVSYRGGSWDFRYQGNLDEVRVWNVARTQQQIIDNMHYSFSTAAGLIACYHFNEGVPNANNTAITTVIDASGNGNNGTLYNFQMNGSTSNYVADAAALPLQLLSFGAKAENCLARIQWQTADENNLQQFILEQSTDGLHFAAAQTLQPLNTSGIQSYSVQLPVTSTILYYRLQTRELSGKAFFSQTVQLSGACLPKLKTWPDPVRDVLYLSAERGQLYRIYNNAGVLVRSGVMESGTQQVAVAGLACGVYWVSVGGRGAARFVKE